MYVIAYGDKSARVCSYTVILVFTYALPSFLNAKESDTIQQVGVSYGFFIYLLFIWISDRAKIVGPWTARVGMLYV